MSSVTLLGLHAFADELPVEPVPVEPQVEPLPVEPPIEPLPIESPVDSVLPEGSSLDSLLEGVSGSNRPIFESPANPEPSEAIPDETIPLIDAAAAAILQQAAEQAEQALLLAQTATSVADWDAVMEQWLSAIALTQSISPDSPARILAQRRLREYLQHLIEAQQHTEQLSPAAGIPSFGSALFDAQLSGYLSYLATEGTPDVLIVGSSRALQGIDPTVMQQTLATQGYRDVKVFNFSVNGATAKVVNFMLREVLPQPLPQVIIWGDGSRALNDGRRDRTWESLAASPGYRTIQAGERPVALFLAAQSNGARSPLAAVPNSLNSLGFSAVSDQFVPQTYYQRVRQVNGRYDSAYSPFTLSGEQTIALQQAATFSADQGAQLIFVNLPLSDSYLDDFRRYYERQFQQFLQTQSAAHKFAVVDLLTQWKTQTVLFADPSHINQLGAAAIATQLAQNPTVLAVINRSVNPPDN
ncbi:MAG: hypothetical protein DCF15_02445 [Phormidesmis priestleyi]|uniref:DUF1574 domain-containing protein n=1 Tax=Phormidesmis priestleyi TaxID=268141 RepID=A0A2W4XRY9_9CYAN|nr:MAG: hypothetical protein DCF15_02445 [Phormidesmis priestleyi]